MKAGVLLVNTGSPPAPTPQAVKSYLAEFLMEPNIRPMAAVPWWVILRMFILPKRKKLSAQKYAAIWGAEGSPLIVGAKQLAERTEQALYVRLDGAHAGSDAPLVRAAMSYGEPSIQTVLAEFRRAGCKRVVVLPLYPQSAKSTTGVALARVQRALKKLDWKPVLDVISNYGDEDLYVQAIADKLIAAGFNAARDHIMFSFHSVPQPDIEAGDTYSIQVDESCRNIVQRLGMPPEGWTVAFQSPFEDRRTWHNPFTKDVLKDVAAHTKGKLFVVCPGFSVDCLETLYDVEYEFRPCAEAAFRGTEHKFVYVSCLNADDAAVALLVKLIEKQLS